MDKLTKLQRPVVLEHLAGPNPEVSFNATYYDGQRVQYGRNSNTTWEALEAQIGDLEGGYGVAFSSGQAAVFAAVLACGRNLVVANDAYVGTRALADQLALRGLIETRLVSLGRGVDELRLSSSDLLLVESPSNPMLSTYPIASLAARAHSVRAIFAVDNTLATPILQNPLRLGADLVIHSATKFISGHSDVLGGIVVAKDEELAQELKEVREFVGAVIGPMEAYLCYRGSKTLGVRVRHATESASRLATRLRERMGKRVLYPGFDPELVGPGKQQSAGGALISLVFDDAGQADAFVGHLELFHSATSLGGVESLAERRSKYRGEELIPPGLVRISVGIEDLDDLARDLDQALGKVGL
jgi:cystathionine beta-lyase/cystathionine gamma-synthase